MPVVRIEHWRVIKYLNFAAASLGIFSPLSSSIIRCRAFTFVFGQTNQHQSHRYLTTVLSNMDSQSGNTTTRPPQDTTTPPQHTAAIPQIIISPPRDTTPPPLFPTTPPQDTTACPSSDDAPLKPIVVALRRLPRTGYYEPVMWYPGPDYHWSITTAEQHALLLSPQMAKPDPPSHVEEIITPFFSLDLPRFSRLSSGSYRPEGPIVLRGYEKQYPIEIGLVETDEAT